MKYLVGRYGDIKDKIGDYLDINIKYQNKDNKKYSEIIRHSFLLADLDISSTYEIEQFNKGIDKIVSAINVLKKHN